MDRASRAVREFMRPQALAISEFYPLYQDREYALSELDDLVERNGGVVYRRMVEQDDQVSSCLRLLQFSAISGETSIVSASTQPKDREIADFVRDNFRYMPGSTLRRTILDGLDALGQGWVCMERVLDEPKRFGPWKGKQFLKCCRPIPQETLRLATDEYGELLSDGVWQAKDRVQNPGVGAPQHYRQMSKDRFVVWSFMRKWGHPYGQSLLRSAYPWYMSKRQAMLFWGRHIETHGTPAIIAKVVPGMSVSAKADVAAQVKRIKYSGIGVIDNNTSLEHLKEVAGSNADYRAYISACNRAIAHALFNPSLLLDNESTGSRALGQTQQDSFIWVMNAIRSMYYEEVLNKQIIQWLVEWNFGEEYECPLAVPRETDPGRLKAMLDLAGFAIDYGVPVGVDYLRELLGLREPADGEMLAEKVQYISTTKGATDEDGADEGSDGAGGPGAGGVVAGVAGGVAAGGGDQRRNGAGMDRVRLDRGAGSVNGVGR